MRFAMIAGCLFALGGCSTASVSPALSGMSNVDIGPGPNGYQYINKVSYRFDGVIVSGDALPACVAQTVQNRSVTLQDSSNQGFVPYLGVVSQKSTRDAGGGQVIKYVSADRRSVVAEGSLPYQYTFMAMPTNESARFSVSAKATGDALSVEFSDIEHAQLDTGYASNDGYTKLGAWPGQHPEIVIAEMEQLANRLSDCVRSQ